MSHARGREVVHVAHRTERSAGRRFDRDHGVTTHAIAFLTDLDPEFNRSYYRLGRFGFAGSRYIVRQLVERDKVIAVEPKFFLVSVVEPLIVSMFELKR